MRRIIYALCLLAALAAISGCGDSDGYGGGSTPTEAETGGPAGVVSTAEVGDLGTILVDSSGLTLYDFHKDRGATSSCYGACAAAWPPLLTEGEPQVESEASAGMVGTTKRKDGTTQVTYAGHPLYTYAGDEKAGEANGNDIDQFGAEWYALQPSGKEPED